MNDKRNWKAIPMQGYNQNKFIYVPAKFKIVPPIFYLKPSLLINAIYSQKYSLLNLRNKNLKTKVNTKVNTKKSRHFLVKSKPFFMHAISFFNITVEDSSS